MMEVEVPQTSPQASRTSTAEIKSVPHKGWAALVTFMAFITYVSTVAFGSIIAVFRLFHYGDIWQVHHRRDSLLALFIFCYNYQ